MARGKRPGGDKAMRSQGYVEMKFYITAKDRSELKEAAERWGMTMAAFVRHVVFREVRLTNCGVPPPENSEPSAEA